MTPPSDVICPAQLEWQMDDNGNAVPLSADFGDVYYSLVDGLTESRYVFIEKNRLPERFANLWQQTSANTTFSIAELGFGTGLNFLATWQAWCAANNDAYTSTSAPRLHFISFEKHPLTRSDLARSLQPWANQDPSLALLIERLLACYPILVAGCHRLALSDSVTLDLWFGDARENLAKLAGNNMVHAWYLDGFAPKVNESLWATCIFEQMARLCAPNATVATFSCAGVVKRGLMDAGFAIAKVKGFGRKREMLTAVYAQTESAKLMDDAVVGSNVATTASLKKPNHIAIIGAGISGLMSAWALAQRGIQITLLDKSAPLAGASGNPRAVLAPKMTPITHVSEHLHSLGYLYAVRFYQGFAPLTHPPVFEQTGVLDLLTKANVTVSQIAEYPDAMATTLAPSEATKLAGLTTKRLSDNLFLPQGGLVNPQAVADIVLNHDRIQFKQCDVVSIEETADGVFIKNARAEKTYANAVVICAAHASRHLDARIFDFRKIRGQLSWFTPNHKQLKTLPTLPLKFGGYCASFTPMMGDKLLNSVQPNSMNFLFGASFVRNDTDLSVRADEHISNVSKVISALPELKEPLEEALHSGQLQARVGIRAQTPDYHPLVGQLDDRGRVWTMSGMGSKGYAFAPLCSEVLADLMLKSVLPISSELLDKLSPNRKRLQQILD